MPFLPHAQCIWGWRTSLAGRLTVVCVLSPGLRGGCTVLLPEWGGKTQFGHLSRQYRWGLLGERLGADSLDGTFQVVSTEGRE